MRRQITLTNLGGSMNIIRKWAHAFCAAASLSTSVAYAQIPPIKIGLPVPLTGPYGAEAKDQVKNAELAVKEFNDAGGLNGRKAELLVRDDKLNPGEAATRALELIEKDKANFIVGGLSAAIFIVLCRRSNYFFLKMRYSKYEISI